MPKATGRSIAQENKFEVVEPGEAELLLPTIHIPLTREQVEELKVGKRAELKIIANVKSLHQGEFDNGVSLEISELEIYSGESNVFEDMARDEI